MRQHKPVNRRLLLHAGFRHGLVVFTQAAHCRELVVLCGIHCTTPGDILVTIARCTPFCTPKRLPFPAISDLCRAPEVASPSTSTHSTNTTVPTLIIFLRDVCFQHKHIRTRDSLHTFKCPETPSRKDWALHCYVPPQRGPVPSVPASITGFALFLVPATHRESVELEIAFGQG